MGFNFFFYKKLLFSGKISGQILANRRESLFFKESIRNLLGLIIVFFQTDSKGCFFRESIRNFGWVKNEGCLGLSGLGRSILRC